MNLILLALSIILFFLLSLRHVYQFQLAEYRFVRFRSMLRDSGFFNLLFVPKFVFPAKTFRNYLIIFFAFILLVIINVVIYNLLDMVLVLCLLNYFFGKISIILGVIITIPFAKIYRDGKIKQAKELIQNSDTVVIGVTGSFGKSSVKEFLYSILSKKYDVEKTEGNRNTNIGVSLEIIEKIQSNPQYFIVEMGAYHIGEIEEICNIVKPTYGCLTGIGNQHMDIFGSIQNLVRAKSELLRSLPKDGLGVVNFDNEYAEELLDSVKSEILTYGEKENVDFRLTDISYKKRMMFVTCENEGKRYKFTTALFGRHHAINLVGCLALALNLGMSYENIQEAIAEIEPMPGKLSIHKGLNDSTIFDDGYNSNLHGFLHALDVISNFEAEKKFVFSYGIFELGKEKLPAYKKIVDFLEKNDIVLLTLDKKFLQFESDKVLWNEDETKVMDFLKENLTNKDLLLIQGRCTNDFLNELQLKKYELPDQENS